MLRDGEDAKEREESRDGDGDEDHAHRVLVRLEGSKVFCLGKRLDVVDVGPDPVNDLGGVFAGDLLRQLRFERVLENGRRERDAEHRASCSEQVADASACSHIFRSDSRNERNEGNRDDRAITCEGGKGSVSTRVTK